MKVELTLLAGYLAGVLSTAGCDKNHQEASDIIYNKFGNKLKAIVDLALQLNQTLGEEITSSDMAVSQVPGDIEFDRLTMDVDGGQHPFQKATDRVLCTTELGLNRKVKVTGNSEQMILLKPKVALESVVDSMTNDDSSTSHQGIRSVRWESR